MALTPEQKKENRINRIMRGTAKSKGFEELSLQKCIQKVASKFQKLRTYQCANNQGIAACCTCGKSLLVDTALCHGGHYISRSHRNTIFDPLNVHAQCAGCNTFKNGQPLEYEFFLRSKYGLDAVENLKTRARQVRQWRRDELAELMYDFEQQTLVEKKRIKKITQGELFDGQTKTGTGNKEGKGNVSRGPRVRKPKRTKPA